MTRLRFACLLLLLGALAWLGWMAQDLTGEAEPGRTLVWTGGALITLGTALAAYDSVSKAPVWLQLVVGVCAPLALWMVLLSGGDMAGDSRSRAAGGFAALLALFALVAFVRSKPEVKHKGAHRD